jgi:calcium-dependent protein kinase
MPGMTETKIKEMFLAIDKNNSGYIDYSEFITSSMDKSYLKNENLVERAFEMIDRDKNGYLSQKELMAAFGGCSDDLERYIMDEFDTNNDGVISKSEFKLAMKGLLKK